MLRLSQLGLYLQVQDVFPSVRGDFHTFRSLVSTLSLTESVFRCAYLNLVVANPVVGHKPAQEFCLQKLLTSAELGRVNKFAGTHGGAGRVRVFSRGQLLELMRWVLLCCHDHEDDGKTFNSENVRRNFVQAALIASDIWDAPTTAAVHSLTREGGSLVQHLVGPSRRSAEGTAYRELPSLLGRGWILMTEYLPRHYPDFPADFRSATGISVEEYYICLAATTSFVNPKGKTLGPFDAWAPSASRCYERQLRSFITIESQTIPELRGKLWGSACPSGDVDFAKLPYYDLSHLREKPIITTAAGRAIISDPVFFSEKATAGPLFHLRRKRDFQELWGYYGKAFEDYCCDILRRIDPLAGCQERYPGGQGDADAYLRACNTLFLFEMKSVLVRDDRVLAANPQDLLRHLREKYVHKGLAQLKTGIDLLACRQWLGSDGELASVSQVYPILLVHDPLVNAPLFAEFFAAEFEAMYGMKARGASGAHLRVGSLWAAPVVVMRAEDIEYLESLVLHGNRFCDIIYDYCSKYPQRDLPFREFLLSSPKYEQQTRCANPHVAGKAQELLDRSLRALFPDEHKRILPESDMKC